MAKIERRSLLKSLGAVSIGLTTSVLRSEEVSAPPYAVKHEKLDTDVLVIGGGMAGVIAAIQVFGGSSDQ